jgi:ABC-type Fe3+ transport system substrate-binding protein
MTKAFTKATGIPVKLDDNSTGPLLTQIEASKNNPNWGLLWVDGATAFAGLDTQGLLLKGFEPSVSWNSLGTQSLPSDKSYTPTGVTLMAALAYNKKKVTTPPNTWQQLLSSQWKGQVGMNDPSQSGPTFPFIAAMMNYLGGVSSGETFFTKLKANGLVIHPTNGPTLQALTSGQINLALVPSSAAIGAELGDKNIGIAYLDPVTLLPSAIGIDAKAPDGTILVEPVLAGAAPFLAHPPLAHLDRNLQAGQDALMMIRPTGVTLYANGSGRPGASQPHHLSGRVADVAFRGRGYEHAIDINENTRLTGIFARARAARGDTVGLRLDPSGCHVFPGVFPSGFPGEN